VRHIGHVVPLHRSYVDAVREVASSEQATLCDLAAEVRALPPDERAGLFRQDAIHLSGAGSRRVARMLFQCMDREGLLALVPEVGVEPTRLSAADFKSAASASSATPARAR
jgi:hypothetical protein